MGELEHLAIAYKKKLKKNSCVTTGSMKKLNHQQKHSKLYRGSLVY